MTLRAFTPGPGADDLEILSQHLFRFMSILGLFRWIVLLWAPGAAAPPLPLRTHREMKLGFVIETAVALYLLLSPAQVGTTPETASFHLRSCAVAPPWLEE